ncbi:Histidine Kinase [Thiobacillus denitrificans ATCC 25259]|uniref:histidine kinase n=1 Tax=Thiobacillus denitrificans (strain ATCC 25259 / T1) TaxID=292415 RepID=Q3SMK8_THIDA|nr:HAMP domain-containing sensor histidine kinase [Thiobacillus denitrificans]AAZ96037.1 Histidine Kinase [Thiobacillus denitrificans ATCC 25259]
MGDDSNKLLQKSQLTTLPCAPGIVAEALGHLSSGDAAALAACVRFDPVLLLRLRALPELFEPQHQDLLRGVLLAAPVAAGVAQGPYGAAWRQSLAVAHLARALAGRCAGADADAAWLAGVAHNLADYPAADACSAAQVAAWVDDPDAAPWLADALRYHAEPLARGRAAHPLLRVVQLAFQLVTRPDALDSVDVRAALAALPLGAAEGGQLLADARLQAGQHAERFGLAGTQDPPSGEALERLARLYAAQAAHAALHEYFREARDAAQVFAHCSHAFGALFGIERAAVFAVAEGAVLRPAALLPAPAALDALAVPVDDGHSTLSRAIAGQAPQSFEGGDAAALVDVQIARVLGVSSFVCQPLVLPDGRSAVLLAGDPVPGIAGAPLWRFLLAELATALQPVSVALAAGAIVPEPAADAISRDRVRRAIHEVANPLTIMRNYVNLLSDRLGADSSVQRDLGIIGDEIERVARIVRGITLAEEHPVPSAPLEAVSVNSVVSELVRMALGTLFTPNKVNVQIDLNPNLPPLPLQKDLLKQVLFNLAKNAVEAMQAGGQLKFTTRLARANEQSVIEIEVADTGPGLPAAVAARLFEPVVSEKGGDHAGLGLAISRNLVERMNGQLSCTSTPQGSHFLIRLPALQGGQVPLTTTRYGSM